MNLTVKELKMLFQYLKFFSTKDTCATVSVPVKLFATIVLPTDQITDAINVAVTIPFAYSTWMSSGTTINIISIPGPRVAFRISCDRYY